MGAGQSVRTYSVLSDGSFCVWVYAVICIADASAAFSHLSADAWLTGGNCFYSIGSSWSDSRASVDSLHARIPSLIVAFRSSILCSLFFT